MRVIATLEPGGAQLGILRVAPELRRHGIETHVIAGHATREGIRLFKEAGLQPEVWPDGRPGLQHELDGEFADWLVPRLANADLVHAHMLGAWWAAARAAPAGVPVVASEHRALADANEDELRRALLRVALVFAHGPSAREQFARLGVGEDRLRSGRSAVGGLDSVPLSTQPSPRVVFAGRLRADKGPDLLLEALALLPDPPVTLILGAGPLERRLRRLVRRRGLQRTVRFLGWQRDPGRFVAGSAACVVPSRQDGWSQTAVQAMGLGVPVVATAVDGLPATLGSNRGILVPPEDPAALARAIVAVVSGELTVDRTSAREYARRFVPERVARAYAAEYRQLVEGERPGEAAA